jgi:nucleosome binding factor SPN SPT16 subunit
MKKSIQSASKTSLALLTKFFEEEMGDIIETERKVTHMKLAERVEAKLDDQKFLKSQKLGAEVYSLFH